MAKSRLAEPLGSLEGQIIDTLIAGHHEYRPDLPYPQSRSDMCAAVRGLLRMFDVSLRALPRELEYHCEVCNNKGRIRWQTDDHVWQEQKCPSCKETPNV